MPIIVPRKVIPIEEAKPAAPPAPAPDYLTHAELVTILTARDAVWAKHLEEMTKAVVAAIPKPQPPKPRKPSKITFEMDNHGNPTGFTITPEN